MSVLPGTLVVAVGIQLGCQLFKVAFYSIRDGKFSAAYFMSAGGIPSSHGAFVTALAVGVGFRSGFASDLFALSFVFAAIVIYDAYRLRGAVERHARLLNRLTRAYHPEEAENLAEMIGHTPLELVAGMVIGGGLAAGAALAGL